VFLLHPFAVKALADWLAASQIWLVALQGLATLALGAFYVQRSRAA
jgi:hypothetical protein